MALRDTARRAVQFWQNAYVFGFLGNTTWQKGGGTLNVFHCRTRIFFGDGALSQLEQCGAGSVLVVTDRFFQESGLAQKVGAMASKNHVSVFSEVTPDPSAELVAKGEAMFRSCQPDLLIALGGGSPMDCAKAILYLQERRPLFVAIPTTSGTGSEVTGFSIVSHGGVKHPIVDEALLPDWAILDPSLLHALPKGLIAETGMDVLAHDLEALAARGASAFSDALARGSFAVCMEQLPASYAGDPAVRGRIHEAATMAGLAFQHAGLGICHSLAHALGGRFHIAHGRLNAILLPAVLEYNSAACLGAYLSLARSIGVSGATERLLLRTLIAAVCRLRAALDLPATLQQAGIPAAELDTALDALADTAMADPCTASNPRSPTRDDLKAILRQVR